MVTAIMCGKTDDDMRDTIGTTRSMAKEHTLIQMAASIEVCGKTGSSTATGA